MSSWRNLLARRELQRGVLAAAVLVVLAWPLVREVLQPQRPAELAGQPAQAPSAGPVDSASALPRAQWSPELLQTYRLMQAGGPFPYDQDGRVFANRERLLPAHPRGFWREYTVPTPGAADRGARRLVCGGEPTRPEQSFYTADHYASFRQLAP